MRIHPRIFYPSFLIAVLVSLFCFFALSGCKKEETTIDPIQTDSVQDVEGRWYKTVKIGDQWWMAENLAVKQFRDGLPIRQAQDVQPWQAELPAYCLNDGRENGTGLLYNSKAVLSSSGLAPQGWHIPTDAEWKKLEQTLGMDEPSLNRMGWRGTNQGEQLKQEAQLGWIRYGDVWNTNASGFTALAGGCRLPDGRFGDPGFKLVGFWWSATTNSGNGIWFRHLDYKTKTVFRSSCNGAYGMSVRCVKD
jgi:uncharacterized protein (TIGR02145 family)